jgi:hypothetical protein
VERRDRVRVLKRPALLLSACGLAALLAASLPVHARAAVFATREQALAEAFPGATIEPKPFVLTDAQRKAVAARARVRLDSRVITPYVARRGDTLSGVAFIDSRTVRTMPGVFLTMVAPDTTVERVEVLAFHEPPDYRPPARWLGLFGRHRLDDQLWPRRDIRNLSGATLSTRAVTESVRLALALYEVVVAPTLSAGAAANPHDPERR